jgi:hypothetical protein
MGSADRDNVGFEEFRVLGINGMHCPAKKMINCSDSVYYKLRPSEKRPVILQIAL